MLVHNSRFINFRVTTTIAIFITVMALQSCVPGDSPPISDSSESLNEPQMVTIHHIPIPVPDIQGHRGARGLFPENTVPSFIKALELGVHTLELDLVVSKDSILVVSHEPWFNPAISTHPDGRPVLGEEGREINMFTMTYEEIRAFDVGLRGNPNFPEQQPMAVPKPTLEEVVLQAEDYLALHDLPPIWYNIETKSEPDQYGIYVPTPKTFARLLYEEILRLGIANRSVVQSFDVNTLIELRKINPHIVLALLIANQDSLEENLNRLGFIPEIYSPNYQLVDEVLIEAVHAKGMRIIPWTINYRAEMQRQLDLGVDGIITDYPDRAQLLRY
jgi:glycerophosphoryl diester phosphodiesterase